MTIAVVIPWRGGQPDRDRHHNTVREHLRALLPDASHIDADSGHQPFNRAAARNHGVRLAEQAGADVVVVCDADTIAQERPLLDAIAGCVDGRLHLPYTWYRGLSLRGTHQYLGGADPAECEVEQTTPYSTGGCLVIQPAAWWRAGGQDERFTGYAAEDSSFRIACDALLGPTVKHPGEIVHLWHPAARHGDPYYAANMALGRRYDAAEGDLMAVAGLVAEHTGQSVSTG